MTKSLKQVLATESLEDAEEEDVLEEDIEGGEETETLPSRYLDDLPDEHINLKSAEAILTPEESAELKKNFFNDMKEMPAE